MSLDLDLLWAVAVRHGLTIRVFTDFAHAGRTAMIRPGEAPFTNWGEDAPLHNAYLPADPPMREVLAQAFELEFQSGRSQRTSLPRRECELLLPLIARDRKADGLAGPLLPAPRGFLHRAMARALQLDGVEVLAAFTVRTSSLTEGSDFITLA